MQFTTPHDISRPAQLKEDHRRSFSTETSMKAIEKRRGAENIALQRLYAGIAVQEGPDATLEIALVFHDGTYSVDFEIAFMHQADALADGESVGHKIISMIDKHRKDNLFKFVGAGVNMRAELYSPNICSRLWRDLDIVPIVFENKHQSEVSAERMHTPELSVDEEADSLARKAVSQFTNGFQPRLQVSHRNKVEVDCGFTAKITLPDDYIETVHARTWSATMQFANSLKSTKSKIAFFNSTPQGGGVALMRHALMRFLHTLELDASWYVPNPVPSIFRITKDNHNILQGVADPKARLTRKNAAFLDSWCYQNAKRHWLCKGGPLAPRSKGGADVIIVDDPQMPALVKIAKEQDPSRPVIFRSHIQIRADLADIPETATAEVWGWVWENVKDADLFISHPVPDFVPANVTPAKVGYLPATTDWLDGLNKDLSDWDYQCYIHDFQTECRNKRQPHYDYPQRKYITQIARFDPSKGIPDVLASYTLLRRKYMKDCLREDTPQLVLVGHGAIDDPDATSILQETQHALETLYSDVKDDVIFMRLGPSDQLLNALMSGAHVALQLSTREGFEVKVSEALHKGIPVIATLRGGIPLQIQDGKSGFLVEAGDHEAVAKHLFKLFTDEEFYQNMANFARDHVSDEVSTVGNALAWLWMCNALSKGRKIEPHSRWISDMAREEAGLPYIEGETILPRNLTAKKE